MIHTDSDRYTTNTTAATTVKASVRVQMTLLMAQMQRWSLPLPPPTKPVQIHQQHFYQRHFWRRQAAWNAIHLLLSPPAPIVHSVTMVQPVVVA